MKKYFLPLVFIIPLAVYLLTICPTVYVGDSGELITASYTLGVAHPPGYPLFCISGKLFSYLPLSNIAYRVNLVSAFFGSLTVLVLFLTLATFSISSYIKWDATVFTSLVFAFSTIFWEQSLTAKGGLYTLNAFFVSLILYLLFKFLTKQDNKKVVLISLICGLGLANHHTMLFFVVMALFFVLWFSRNKLKSFLSFVFLGFGVCILLYLYLLVVSNLNPPINWGKPNNLARLFDHIFRKQYGSALVPLTFTLYVHMAIEYSKLIFRQFNILFLFVPFGIFYLFKYYKKFFYLTVVSFCLFCFTLLCQIERSLSVHSLYTHRVFFIPAFILFWIWIASGIFYILEKVKYKFLTNLTFILPVLFLVFNYSNNDKSKSFLLHDYGLNVLKTVPKDSIIFTAGDHSAFVLTYLQNVESIRTDVKLYDDEGTVFENIYGEDFLKISIGEHKLRLNAKQIEIIKSTDKQVFFILGSNIHNMAISECKINYKPFGLLYKITNEDIKSLYSLKENLNGLVIMESHSNDYLEKDLLSQIYFMKGEYEYAGGNVKNAEENYTKAMKVGLDVDTIQNNMAIVFQKPEFKDKMLEFYQNLSIKNSEQADVRHNLGNAYFSKGDFDSAEKEYLIALKLNPKYTEAWNNLGVVYYNKKELSSAVECFKKALELNPADSNLFVNSINILRELGLKEEARNFALEGVKIHKDNKILRFVLGNLYLNENKLDMALEEYEYIVKFIDNKYAEVYNNIGVVYIRKNDLKKSKEYFKMALSIKPDYTEALRNLKDVEECLRK
ncbi:MAG: DUF2723 domain-containing protein [Candidatus Firestonebacteria bacterium]